VQYGDAISILRGIPLFCKLDPAKLNLLAFSSTSLTFEEGEELFREGDPADGAYIIEEGKVDVLRGQNGRWVKVGSLGKFDLFGEMALILNQTRSATIRATQHLKVLKIDADVFLRLVTENPDAALTIMRSLSKKITSLTERYQELERHINGQGNG
jgi:CRP/FNR family transcriptional regulator, cyclic AMP receptor protein